MCTLRMKASQQLIRRSYLLSGTISFAQNGTTISNIFHSILSNLLDTLTQF
jgi:hypothetical protein